MESINMIKEGNTVNYLGCFIRGGKYYAVFLDKKCTNEMTQITGLVTRRTYNRIRQQLRRKKK